MNTVKRDALGRWDASDLFGYPQATSRPSYFLATGDDGVKYVSDKHVAIRAEWVRTVGWCRHQHRPVLRNCGMTPITTGPDAWWDPRIIGPLHRCGLLVDLVHRNTGDARCVIDDRGYTIGWAAPSGEGGHGIRAHEADRLVHLAQVIAGPGERPGGRVWETAAVLVVNEREAHDGAPS